MGKLTTHVLDTANGRPAAGMRIELHRLGENESQVASFVTNSDGRCDRPLLEDASFTNGRYRLVFHAGDYFAAVGLELPEPKFLERVVIEFGIAECDQHYHVPLLLSPYSYSTYRGS